jgi:hypothetical protein
MGLSVLTPLELQSLPPDELQACDRREMFLALTPTGGEDAASTAGQEAGVTSRDNATSRDKYISCWLQY